MVQLLAVMYKCQAVHAQPTCILASSMNKMKLLFIIAFFPSILSSIKACFIFGGNSGVAGPTMMPGPQY